MSPTTSITNPASLLTSWLRFVSLVSDVETRDLIGTAETVEALIARSLLQEQLDVSGVLDAAELAALDEGDRSYRSIAKLLLERSRVVLYREHHPAHHWWWRVDELVLGGEAENLLDVHSAAGLKGVHPHTVRAAIRQSSLPARRLGRGFLIRRKDLERWQPRRAGRPSRGSGDPAVDSFNTANTAKDFKRSHEIALTIAVDPYSPRRCLALGIDAYNQADYTQSLAWADRALAERLDLPRKQTAMIVKGLALVRLRRGKEAVDTLRPFEAEPPEAWQGSAALAEAFLSTRMGLDAERAIARAVEADPDAPEPRYLAARISFHVSKPWDALEHVAIYRFRSPDEANGLVLHGSILGFLGDRSHDQHLYVRAAELFRVAGMGGGPRGRAKYAVALAKLGHWDRALKMAGQLKGREDPSVVRWIVQSAVSTIAEQGRTDDLIVAMDTVDRSLGPLPVLRPYRAALHAAKGDVVGTLSALGMPNEEAAQAHYEDRMVLAVALLIAGRPAEATHLLRPTDLARPAVRHHLLWARAAMESKDLNSVREAFEALTVDTGDVAQAAIIALGAMQIAEQHSRWEALARVVESFAGAALAQVLTEPSDRAPAPKTAWDLDHAVVSSMLEGQVTTVTR
jgi:excisionase family DNA binding protein